MGWYFNKGRGNLPLTLASGMSFSVPGNSWVELSGRNETTSSVLRARAKGFLHRQDNPPAVRREKLFKPLVKKVVESPEKITAADFEQPPDPRPQKVRKRRKTAEAPASSPVDAAFLEALAAAETVSDS